MAWCDVSTTASVPVAARTAWDSDVKCGRVALATARVTHALESMFDDARAPSLAAAEHPRYRRCGTWSLRRVTPSVR